MTIGVQDIRAACPDLDEQVVREHLARVDADYLGRFGPAEIARHVRGLARLSASEPVQVLLQRRADGIVSCTVLAYDYPFEFSLIAGVLAGTGFRIDSGEVFTLAPVQSERPTGTHGAADRRRSGRMSRRHMAAAPPRDPLRRWVIIDCFRGELTGTDAAFEEWARRTTAALGEVVAMLDRGDTESVERAKRRVNELVTAHLAAMAAKAPQPPPVELVIDQPGGEPERRTRLRIVGQDTPAFLYSLSTALSLHGLCIDRVHISSDGGRVEDEIFLIDPDGRPITDAQILQRIKLSVLLTKQFAYYLAKAPDPFTALTRFEQLSERIAGQRDSSEWIELLGDPRTMAEMARLLGTSHYLWEDFIRVQYEELLPMFRRHLAGLPFCEPLEALPQRMAHALDGAADLAERQDRLNRFKDREIFLIDLDHILTPGTDFRELSLRLSLLAENLIATAARLVYEDLVRTWGRPPTPGADRPGYAVFGLGKLGGVSLGYASDIELLFVYDADGRTAGAGRGELACTEFFELFVRETARFIRTKREGIFAVDLRLRPHGSDGPLACSLDQFRTYYGPGGAAHAFEKLALTRLRWLGGDLELGFVVEQMRDRFLYEQGDIDLDSLWEVLERQHAQKSQPGRLNAKHSPGALADLESTVQLLQVMHAGRAPQLRTPRLREVLEGLRRAGALSAADYAELVGAYYFFRRLINALRMLRGNAQDLFLPPLDSAEYLHLARRVGYPEAAGRSPVHQLAAEFERRTATVAGFLERRFGRPCPGSAQKR